MQCVLSPENLCCMTAGHDQPVEDADERLLDMVMLHLRLSDGLDFWRVADCFGEGRVSSIQSALRLHIDKGLVEERGSRIRLTDPEGFLRSNDIISDACAALDQASCCFYRHER